MGDPSAVSPYLPFSRISSLSISRIDRPVQIINNCQYEDQYGMFNLLHVLLGMEYTVFWSRDVGEVCYQR